MLWRYRVWILQWYERQFIISKWSYLTIDNWNRPSLGRLLKVAGMQMKQTNKTSNHKLIQIGGLLHLIGGLFRQFVPGHMMRSLVPVTSPKRICGQGLGKSETLRAVGTPESKERCQQTLVTFPAKRVNMTTPRLHQSTTWVYASPLRISGATKHGQKKNS